MRVLLYVDIVVMTTTSRKTLVMNDIVLAGIDKFKGRVLDKNFDLYLS